MAASRPSSRPSSRQPSRAPSRRAGEPRVLSGEPRALSGKPSALSERLGLLAAWLVVLVPPFLLSLSAKEAFRLPKLMASEGLALASLLFLAWQVRKVETVRFADLWRWPAVRAVVPLLLVATLGLWTTEHPLHVREGLIDLWIGAAALIGWSLGLPARRQRQLLGGLLLPATGLGLFGILQLHGIFQLPVISIAHDQRLNMTSTAGNPGDLGVYLVLPCLIAQWILIGGAAGRARWLPGWLARWFPILALAVCLYAMALTQTLAALAALAAGSLLLWISVLPRRRVALLLGGGAALVLVLVLAVAPLRTRVTAKAGAALHGDWNTVLTGRLDGWRAAVWMLRENPWTGVGQGAFRPSFVPAKLALLDRGAPFYAGQLTPVFANAHNEYLEAAADWGIPGILALAWGLWTLGAALRGIRGIGGGAGRGRDQGLAVAGAAALAILSLAHFPFRIALVGYPALLFLSWVLRPREEGEEGEADS